LCAASWIRLRARADKDYRQGSQAKDRSMNDAIDRRELAFKALAGLLGGAIGWIPVEIVSHGRSITQTASLLVQIGSVVSMALFWGVVGGFIVAAQGKSLNLTPAVRRRFILGLVICFLIGLPAVYYSNVVFTAILAAGGWGANHPGSPLYLHFARIAGWVLMGFVSGAGVGLATGSLSDPAGTLRNVAKGAVGGWVGGFVGGFAFDIIGAVAGGLFSRLFGLCALGLAIGLLIGLVQELTKSAWLNVEAGRLRGRSFNIDRAVATVGRAEENVVGLFGDAAVQPRHAVIERHGNAYVLKNLAVQQGVFVNGNRVENAQLGEGDRIRIGGYEMSFHLRRAVSGPRPAIIQQYEATPSVAAVATHPPVSARPPVAPQTSTAEQASAVAAAQVVERNGNGWLVDGNGRRYQLRTGTATTLGRAVDNDIVISDASVSRHHASIVPHDSGFVLRDLGSQNGTYLAGRRIAGERKLIDGDDVRLGDAPFVFHG
jgi:pSer/pThr/pTyr-binding forkhead associated (FHA) protein